jgi:hypothetical protein
VNIVDPGFDLPKVPALQKLNAHKSFGFFVRFLCKVDGHYLPNRLKKWEKLSLAINLFLLEITRATILEPERELKKSPRFLYAFVPMRPNCTLGCVNGCVWPCELSKFNPLVDR